MPPAKPIRRIAQALRFILLPFPLACLPILIALSPTSHGVSGLGWLAVLQFTLGAPSLYLLDDAGCRWPGYVLASIGLTLLLCLGMPEFNDSPESPWRLVWLWVGLPLTSSYLLALLLRTKRTAAIQA